MKQLLLILLFLTTFSVKQSEAQQACTPDAAISNAMIYPAVLPFAMSGYYYYQTLTFRVPHDTVIVYQTTSIPATIDSAQLLYIKGIPKGYTYVCNVPTCTWKGGTLGCAQLMGYSDSTGGAQVGEYPITIYVKSWVNAASTNFTRIDSSSDYTFKIMPFNGIFEIARTEPLKVFPNPATDNIHIELRDLRSDNNELYMYDLSGKIVFHKTIESPTGFPSEERVDMSGFTKGLYLVLLRSGDRSMTSKVQLK